jgi:dihydrolipoamide dehydrogenase
MPSEVRTPNIGDFTDVEIIEVYVKVGDRINKEDSIVTLESDKATMDIPSPLAGTIKEVKVKPGDRISEGDLLLIVEEEAGTTAEKAAGVEKPAAPAPEAENAAPPPPAARPAPDMGVEEAGEGDIRVDVVVLGSGPGGYTAAFRAADLGLSVALVERYEAIGGVCLNVGCIPSKALLHAAKVISETREAKDFGIDFGAPKIDAGKLLAWKQKVVGQLTNGLKGLAKQRKVQVVTGTGAFASPKQLLVEQGGKQTTIGYKYAVIAAGSQAATLPFLPDDERIMDSTGALELADIPKRLLVLGGGIVGLEMATVYYELGSRVTVVEMLDSLIAGADADIVRPLQKRITGQYENIYLSTKVTAVKADKTGLKVTFEGAKAPKTGTFDRILVAVGRVPNGNKIGADQAGVNVDTRGFIHVDDQMRTNVPHIFAIGDIAGPPMLAHKATHEGKLAAEVIAGHKAVFDNRVIPSVAYTDPEVAWVGVTEKEAKEQGLDYGKGAFPWAASGRSLSLGRSEGMTKLIFDKQTGRVIGGGIVGPNAGDLIAEVTLAIEMGADAEDIGLTIHPHPTLSETVAFAAEMFEGTITDLYAPKKI